MKPMQSQAWSNSSLDGAFETVTSRSNQMTSEPMSKEMAQELQVSRSLPKPSFTFLF